VVEWFKTSDIDPREIILLFKDLFQTSQQLQANHVRQPPKAFLLQTLQHLQLSNKIGSDFNVE
jgi:hypothetical protein